MWNIRGLNKRHKQKELSLYPKEKKIKLAGIVETRVKEEKASIILNNVAPSWNAIHKYAYARNGRVWVLWDSTMYDVTVITSHAHLYIVKLCVDIVEVSAYSP